MSDLGIREWMKEGGLVDARWSIVGGLIVASILLTALIGVGRVSGYEMQVMLSAAIPSLRYLGSTVVTGGLTVLALMVTFLSFSESVDTELTSLHYRRIQQIAYMAALAVGLAVILLLLMSIPVEETEDMVIAYAGWVYYGLVGLASFLGGVTITIVLMLVTAVHGLIQIVNPHVENPRDEVAGSRDTPRTGGRTGDG